MAEKQTIAVLNGTARVSRHLVHQALAHGQRVRAIVRSSSRFYAQTAKHEALSAHEWSDFNDLHALAPILDGVDVLFVALCPPESAMQDPTALNVDALTAICTVLHDAVAPGSRCATKIVLLSAFPATPGAPQSVVGEALLGHQMNDLRAAQQLLRKQQGWLDTVYLMPGGILDCEDSADAATLAAVRLQEGGAPDGFISYARLAAAMRVAGAEAEWNGKFLVPVATTPTPWGIKYMGGAFGVMKTFVVRRVIPAAARACVWGVVCGGVGYVLGARDGGAWALRTLGWNVRG